jgi:hypothetical protein
MLKTSKQKSRATAVATALAAAILSNTVGATGVPSTNACSKLTRERIANFRTAVGVPTSPAGPTGAIATLLDANVQGEIARIALANGAGGGWNNTYGLRVVADRVDENAFLAPPCKSMFYPWGTVVPNNINACFRGDVAPQLELELYWSTLHGYYNKVGYSSRPSAELAFNTVRDLLKESRSISNDAVTCLFEQGGDNLLGPLLDPN